MKLKAMKTVFTILLAASLTATTACSSAPSSESTNNASSSQTATENTPYGKYSSLITYTLGKDTPSDPRMPNGDTYENNAYTRYLKEKLNIQNQDVFEAQNGDNYKQKVSLAISSGTIPDVMIVNDLSTLKQLVESDLIEDLTQSYKDCASDKIKEIYNSYDGRCMEQATFDKKLMALPSTNIGEGTELLWIRQDWMDKLNLKAPKTLDDVENIIQQFIQKDPGGNGPGKTIGLTATSDIAGTYGSEHMLDTIFSLYGAFPGNWLKGTDNKIYYGSVAPEMKTALTKLADMYKKGEIDKQFAVRSTDDINALLISGKCGTFFGPWWAPNYPLMDEYKNDNSIVWTPYVAPLDESGNLKYYAQNPCEKFVVVRKGFEHPELIWKMANMLFDYERYTDKNPEEINKYESLGVDRGVMPLSINIDYNDAVSIAYHHIQDALDKKIDPKDLMTQEKAWYTAAQKYKDGDTADANGWSCYYARVPGSKAAEDPAIKLVNPVFYGRTDTMKLKWANLQKAEKETMLKIVTGDQPVNSFDEFVKTWKSTGGDQITEEVNSELKG